MFSFSLNPEKNQKYLFPLLYYMCIVFLMFLADGIMTYVAPIFIDNQLNSTFLMGCILGLSAFVALVCDTIFPTLFFRKKTLFFSYAAAGVALLFPVIFLVFPHQVPFFILAMIAWGLYYELLIFSNFHFVRAYVTREHRPLSWGMLSIFRSIGMILAPLLSTRLLHQKMSNPLWLTIAVLIVTLFTIFGFQKFFMKRNEQGEPNPSQEEKHQSFTQQMKVWALLLKKIWPIYMFYIMLFILESTYLSIGALLSEELLTGSIWGNFIIPAFVLPGLFVGLLVDPLCRRLGKKKTAFVAGATGGFLLLFTWWISAPFFLVVIIFCSSIFTGLATPAILSAVQDYIGRMGAYGGDLIGLQSSGSSIGYILGSVLAGAIAAWVGTEKTFAVIGGVLLAVSLLCLWVVPKKVRLPQGEIDQTHLIG
jgi:MFS family permease